MTKDTLMITANLSLTAQMMDTS